MKQRTNGLAPDAVASLYRRRARSYDRAAQLFRLVGVRHQRLRRRAIARLDLRPGDTVVDIACGTGLNFAALQKAVGPTGRIIGVDVTDAMLEQAARRVNDEGWSNVELVCCNATEYEFPDHVDGVFSSFALALVPNHERVVAAAHGALGSGQRFVELGIKRPPRRLAWMEPLLFALIRPFGAPEAAIDAGVWKTVERVFGSCSVQEVLLGFLYVAVGEKRAAA